MNGAPSPTGLASTAGRPAWGQMLSPQLNEEGHSWGRLPVLTRGAARQTLQSQVGRTKTRKGWDAGRTAHPSDPEPVHTP